MTPSQAKERTATMSLNLHRLVDKAYQAELSPDPHVIARHVLMRIKPEDRDEALLVALATYAEARGEELQGLPLLQTPTVARGADVRGGKAR
jgi:hypothetical protein